MEVTLTVIRGNVSRGEIVFHPPAVLGRSREADLTIAHPMISRQHCELYELDGLLMIRDLGSLNGTLVRDSKVKDSPLCPDACFSVGPLTFQVQYHYDGDTADVPPPRLAASEEPTPPAETAAVDGPTLGGPVFAEMDSDTDDPAPDAAEPHFDAVPDIEQGPWADARPADDVHEEAVPRDDNQAQPDANAEFPDVLPSDSADSGEIAAGAVAAAPIDDRSRVDVPEADASEADAADMETPEADEPELSVQPAPAQKDKPQASKPAPGKKKRAWSLWPFGGKKEKPKTKEQATAPAAGPPAETEFAEAASPGSDRGEAPSELPATRDTEQDEAVAAFLTEPPSEPKETDRSQPDDKPDTEQPDTEEPDTEQPDTEQPDTEEPDTEEPDTEEPDTDEPASNQGDDPFQDFLKGLR